MMIDADDFPDMQTLLNNITPEVYEALKRAVELGRWANGARLTAAQRETCLQAVIYYDGRHKPEGERIGYIQPQEHEHCGSEGDKKHDHAGNRWDEEQLLVFRQMSETHSTRH
ncbi:MAG: DUF1315 family protein [Pseudomonadales bacterium]